MDQAVSQDPYIPDEIITPPTPWYKTRWMFLILILLTIALVLLMVIAYLITRDPSPVSTPAPTPSPTHPPSATNTTTGWQTYTIRPYGSSFIYPPSYRATLSSKTLVTPLLTSLSIARSTQPYPEPQLLVDIYELYTDPLTFLQSLAGGQTIDQSSDPTGRPIYTWQTSPTQVVVAYITPDKAYIITRQNLPQEDFDAYVYQEILRSLSFSPGSTLSTPTATVSGAVTGIRTNCFTGGSCALKIADTWVEVIRNTLDDPIAPPRGDPGVFTFENDEKALRDYTKKFAEVYGAQTAPNSLSLYGSTDFYIKVIPKPSPTPRTP